MGCHNRHNHASIRRVPHQEKDEGCGIFFCPMPFSERAKAVALAIVKIFETAKPFGNYSAVAVLADGAGISYGTSQFTHRSGSLAAVITRYARLSHPKSINRTILDALSDFRTGRNIPERSANKALKAALAEAGKDPLMQQAQREIAFENYLRPALNACEGSDFVYPLSLAVIYDSINQGGYDTVRDRTIFDPPGNGSIKPEEFEKEWITEYCRQRKKWLSGSRKPIVRATTYRPEFFLGEIKRGNWELKLPMTVHGHKLTEAILFPKASTAAPQPLTIPASAGEIEATSSNQGGPATTPAVENNQAVETTVVSEDGTKAVTAKNEQSVTEVVVQSGPVAYNDGKGLKDTLIGDAKAVLPANVGVQSISEYAQQASGWPEWIIALLGKVAIAALVATALWIVYRFVSYLVHTWRENERVKLLAMINTDTTRKDIEIK